MLHIWGLLLCQSLDPPEIPLLFQWASDMDAISSMVRMLLNAKFYNTIVFPVAAGYPVTPGDS